MLKIRRFKLTRRATIRQESVCSFLNRVRNNTLVPCTKLPKIVISEIIHREIRIRTLASLDCFTDPSICVVHAESHKVCKKNRRRFIDKLLWLCSQRLLKRLCSRVNLIVHLVSTLSQHWRTTLLIDQLFGPVTASRLKLSRPNWLYQLFAFIL